MTSIFLEQSNASSGMGVADHGKNAFLQLKRKKVHRYVIFKIDEKKKEVVVEKTGTPAESFDDFTASLPKMIADTRSPATSRVRAKMLYATSKDAFKRELDGFHYEIQATDPTEVDLEVLKDRAH
ncbi:hypothetical protein RND71_013958 [Anisodus tanguticus]|uniref:ADF-H domain-containing protein n=1 Tax=Anisodus tanguticus TaxID=243964 RepID=A0AAE1SB18_9SOLA|nr:hypothetical protein RND71_013958 [Anisodus tanguticus]